MASKRITLVADQILGYFRTGGLGTATTFLALALARMGHEVEVLYFGDVPSGPVDPEWTTLYERAGVRIRPLERSGRRVEPSYFAGMRDLELDLRADPPDVVVVQDLGAPGYSALRLRRLGLAFEKTLFVVYCHGSRQWIKNMSRKVRVLPGALAVSRLEQASVELADIAVSPSRYMVDWMRNQGWKLPDRTVVIPLLTRSAATGEPPPQKADATDGSVERIVFFGRLEERKGVEPFAAGLNALPPDQLRGVDVEFLGRPTKDFAPDRVQALLSEGTRGALRSLSFETNLDQHEALARLSRPGTVAVVPSLEDNSPNVVYECLERGIPFLASAAGGTSELVAPEDRSRVLFEPTAEGVAEALQRALEGNGVARPAQPAFDGPAALQQWSDVVVTTPAAAVRPSDRPTVEAIVVHRASSGALDRCLSALSDQTYDRLRVIVAATTDARPEVEHVVVHAPGVSIEGVRQAALREAQADWVLFLEENDVAESGLVETLVRAQAVAAADAVSCAVRLQGDGAGSTERFFSGNPGGLGVIANDYGTISLLRRAALLDDGGSGWEVFGDPDWPLLARLSLAGARLVAVPLPLATRTASPGTAERHPSDALLLVEQFEEALPGHLRYLARLAAGLAADASLPAAGSGSVVRRISRRLRGRGR